MQYFTSFIQYPQFFDQNLCSLSDRSIVRPTAQSQECVHIWEGWPEVPGGRGRALPLCGGLPPAETPPGQLPDRGQVGGASDPMYPR